MGAILLYDTICKMSTGRKHPADILLWKKEKYEKKESFPLMKNPLNEKKPNGLALIPFVIFIAIYMGAGVYYQVKGKEMAFYQFPSVTAMFLAVLAAFIMFKGTINEKFDVFAKGAANVDILTMLMIYILAGAFASVAANMGGRESTVNLGLSLVPVQFLAAGLFVISAFMGTATGSSMGTVSAVIPIAVGIAEKGGLSLTVVIGAVVGGAMFGDNLSMISDTTIAATRGCGCEMRDKFKMNGVIAAVAAVLAMVIYTVVGSAAELTGDFSYEFIKVIPYIFILVFALTGCNVFILLLAGIGVAGAIGFATGSFDIPGFAQAMGSGMSGMYDICLIALLLRGVGGVAEELGAIDWLVKKMHASVKTRKGAEYMTAGMVSVFDAAMANNTIAIMMAAPLVRKVVAEHNVAPKRAASILDIFSCVVQGIIPHGGQILLCVSLTGLSPFSIIGANYYCFLLALVALATIQFGLGRTKEEKEGIRMYDENDEVVALK